MKTIYNLMKTTAFYFLTTLTNLLMFVGYTVVTLLCAVALPFKKLVLAAAKLGRRLTRWHKSDMSIIRASAYRGA